MAVRAAAAAHKGQESMHLSQTEANEFLTKVFSYNSTSDSEENSMLKLLIMQHCNIACLPSLLAGC